MKKKYILEAGAAVAIALMLTVGMSMAQQAQADVIIDQVEDQCPCCTLTDEDDPKEIICPIVQAEAPGLIQQLQSNLSLYLEMTVLNNSGNCPIPGGPQPKPTPQLQQQRVWFLPLEVLMIKLLEDLLAWCNDETGTTGLGWWLGVLGFDVAAFIVCCINFGASLFAIATAVALLATGVLAPAALVAAGFAGWQYVQAILCFESVTT